MAGDPQVFGGLVFACIPHSKPLYIGGATNLRPVPFLMRYSAKGGILFGARETLAHVPVGPEGFTRQTISYNGMNCHLFRSHHLALGVAVITTFEYPLRVAHLFVREIEEAVRTLGFSRLHLTQLAQDEQYDRPFDQITEQCDILLKKYKNPVEADKLLKVRMDIADTKDILVTSLAKILERGEALDELAKKSADLDFQAQLFLESAEDLNSCCSIL